MKYQFKRKPYAYQYNALRRALKLGDSAIWFDPGLGKTKVGIDFCAIKAITEDKSKVLVVGPLSAIGVWNEEWYVDCPDDIPYEVVPIVGDMPERLTDLKKVIENQGNTVIIVNYDTLKNEKAFALIKQWGPQILIVDEMHYCKNSRTIRNKVVYLLSKLSSCSYRLGLTGTPMPKNILDVFGQYLILNEGVFGNNWHSFRHRYADFHPVFKSKPIKFKNTKEFSEKMHSIAIRVKDSDIKGLPPLIVKDVPVLLGKKSKAIYKQMADEMLAELDNNEKVTASLAATKVIKLQQITGGFLQDIVTTGVDEDKVLTEKKTYYVGAQEKLQVMKELIDMYSLEHKIIVGCRFLTEIAMIAAYLEKEKIGFHIIKGGVDGKERDDYRIDFQNNPACRIIIFQVSSATAMTLTAGDIAILYSCTHKWDDYFQWLKRLHRRGQKKPVYLLRLIAKGTVDREVINSVETKKNLTEQFVDRSSYRVMLTPKF